MMNKKRLAVLAMSAVMTASTVSMPVNAMDFSDGAGVQAAEAFSAGVDAQSVEVTEEVSEDVAANITYTIVDDSVTWNTVDGTVTFTVHSSDGTDLTYSNKQGTKQDVEGHEATCTAGGKFVWVYKVEVGGWSDTLTSGPVEGTPLGHNYEYAQDYTKAPTCTDTGILTTGYRCTRCKEWDPTRKKDTTVAAKHQLDGVNIVKYEELNNVTVDNNGNATLIKKEEAGSWKVVTYQHCSACDTDQKVSEELKTLEPEHTTEAKRVVKADSTENIAQPDDIEGEEIKDLPEADKIELTDCTKDGAYWVQVLDSKDAVLYEYKVTVKAHHVKETPYTIEYVNKEDEGLLSTRWDAENETLVVANASCEKEVEYYEVIKCSAANCKLADKVISKEKKVAAKSTIHTAAPQTKTYIEGLKKADKAVDYAAIVSTIEGYKEANFVKIVPETATCDNAGTVAVEFTCMLCGEKAATISGVKVNALGHDEATRTENEKGATCEADGSYDVVKYCERCGKEIERTHVVGKRLPHTNENYTGSIYTDKTDSDKDSEVSMELVGRMVIGPFTEGQKITNTDGIGDDTGADGKLLAYVFTNCGVCHNHEVKLDAPTVTYTITNVTDETTNKYGEVTKAGSITVKAVYTTYDKKEVSMERTLPYFSSASVQLPDENKNGLLKDADGVYRYYESGVFQDDFTAMIDYAGRQLYVVNGVLASGVSGLMMYEDTWYYLNYGEVANYTGTVMYNDSWFYVSNGVLNTDVNGLVPYNGGTFLFIAGYMAQNVNGLWMEPNTGDWYYLSLGRVLTEYTGVAMYDNAFFYIRNGKLARDYNGTVEFEGATFKVSAGQLYGQVK